MSTHLGNSHWRVRSPVPTAEALHLRQFRPGQAVTAVLDLKLFLYQYTGTEIISDTYDISETYNCLA